MSSHYDAIVIGAGMSGLATAIRLAMFDKKVVLLEKHSISGGLNSYYSRKIKDTGEKFHFDVGLHALTNFATKGERRKPLTKLLKQLRIPYDSLQLQEQTYSEIHFKSAQLKFSNDFNLLESEVHRVFPHQIDAFRKFTKFIIDFDDLSLQQQAQSARSVLAQYFSEKLLSEMIIAPLLIYGSAWEEDMDFSQFVTMYKALYLEGFSKPVGGVRTILDLLLDRAREVGVELRFKTGVKSIITKDNKVMGVNLKKEDLFAPQVYSSVGLPETYTLIEEDEKIWPVGKLSFMESLLVTRDKSFLKDFNATIVFYNESDVYQYRRPDELYDPRSAVFCLPDNYQKDQLDGYGLIRVTYMANFNLWNNLAKPAYKAAKADVFEKAFKLSKDLLSIKDIDLVAKDVFSPTTIKKYTGHLEGTVYGSPQKSRDGSTNYTGLYITGTDQGFLGIVGSLLSGISMANFHGLMEHK